MKIKKLRKMCLLCIFLSHSQIFSGSIASAQDADKAFTVDKSKLSLLDLAPSLLSTALRYPKYYSDPNMNRKTVDGPLSQRQYLLGSLNGARDRWAQKGFIFSGMLTQTIQGTVDGSGDDTPTRLLGSLDFYLGVDTGRAGLWPGGLVVAHAEGNWDRNVTGTGSLLPLNADGIMPSQPSSFALSELYLFQGLPNDYALVAGKFSVPDFADKSFFANSERNQFLHQGLVNNGILGAFVPYTTWGLVLSKQITPTFSTAGVVIANNTKATTVGLEDLDADELTGAVVFNWTPKFTGNAGSYELILGYTNKDAVRFDVDSRYFLDSILGRVPVIEKDRNYAFTLNGSQYFWTDPSARRSDGQTVGWGPFFRIGAGPSDRNLIDRFYSVGIGGNGGVAGRHEDNWGIGYAYTGFSNDLRDRLRDFGADIDNRETAFEAFYNIAWTPAIRTSFHIQYVDSANPMLDDATVLAARLQLDF